MSAVYNIIRNAILQKHQVIATYQGYQREMCPHVLGTKRGHERALCFQFAGGSRKRLPPTGQWRCIDLDQLSNVSTRQGPWHTGSRRLWTDQKQTCVDWIDG